MKLERREGNQKRNATISLVSAGVGGKKKGVIFCDLHKSTNNKAERKRTRRNGGRAEVG